jgi:hypothetical protein
MTHQPRWTLFAVVGWSLAVIGGVGGHMVRLVWPAPLLSTTFGIGPTAMVAITVLGLIWSTVGALLVIRRAENPVGRIMILVGVGFAISVLTVAVASAARAEGTASGGEIASVVGGATALVSPAVVLVFYLPFIFPTGRGHTPRWDAIGRGCLAFAMVLATLLVLQPGDVHLLPGLPNPVGIGPNLRPVFGEQVTGGVGALTTVIVAPLLILSVVSRYRVAGRIERQQLKWFILATVITVVTVAIMLTATVLSSDPIGEIPVTAFALAGATVPVAIGVAILRYHLFEIDRIVSRTIAYGVITAILIATYSGAILLLTGPLGNLFGGDTVSVALSTLVVAAIFQPLRRRVQGVVDRSFDRARFDAERTTAAFSDRLRDEVDIKTVMADLDRTVRSALKPTSARLWLRSSVRR